MTDPREALSRLTRWRSGTATPGYQKSLHFLQDVSALLSLVEKQQEALTEWEIAADEGCGDAMLGVAITPDWFRGKRREADRLRDSLSLQVARLKEARRDALEEAAKIAEEWHVWYEKPGSGTRHALCVARDIRAALSSPTGGDRE